MSLLLDEDYQYLAGTGLEVDEDERSRFVIFRDFPLPKGMYKDGAETLEAVDVLFVVPGNYNASGGDMFWVHPFLTRVDGKAIPAVSGPRQDSRTHAGTEYTRWSRHWNGKPWKPKVDNIQTVVDRITWALANPDAKRT
jgi:hypothetical protein